MNFNSIVQIFVPKENKFYPLFEKSSANLVLGTETFIKVLKSKDAEERLKLIHEFKEIEHLGDNVTYEIIKELHSTFITPFDREDIQELASHLDDVLDCLNGACQRIEYYQPNTMPKEFTQIASVINKSAIDINKAVKELRNKKNFRIIGDLCDRINDNENDVDTMYNEAMKSLFENEKDAIELIKHKDILSKIEKAADRTEDVSDTLRTLIIKSA